MQLEMKLPLCFLLRQLQINPGVTTVVSLPLRLRKVATRLHQVWLALEAQLCQRPPGSTLSPIRHIILSVKTTAKLMEAGES